MAIYPSDRTTPSPQSSYKLKQKKVISYKRKLLRKTPQRLGYQKIKQEETDRTRMSQGSAGSSLSEAKSPVLRRAEEVQSKLTPAFPSFLKLMLRSHVTGGFWLQSLPKSFCYLHMPKHDDTVWLVGESVEEFRTNYLVRKNGLSGGWRGFSIAHELVEGDVVVFQLIESRRFKVYIVRADILADIDGAISLLKLDSQAKPTDIVNGTTDEFEDVKNIITAGGTCLLEPCENGSRQQDGTDDTRKETTEPDRGASVEEAGNEGADLGSLVSGGIRLAESLLQFKDVKGFGSFSIIVDGLVIDTEIPLHHRYKYFELCCSQDSFLHDHLVKGLNCKLAAGIISETVNIADVMRAAKLTTSLEHLQSWDKTLKAFEDMGMKVEFLRSRLKKLVCLSYEQHEIIGSKKLEQCRVEEEIRDLEAKLSEVKEAKESLDAEIEALNMKYSNLEASFKNTATAPW